MAVVRGVVTLPPVRGTAVAMPPVAAVQGVFCAARSTLPLVGRTLAAAVGSAGMVAMAFASFGILLLQQLSHGGRSFRFSCAGLLVGGAVAVSGTVLLAGAGAAARLLLAS